MNNQRFFDELRREQDRASDEAGYLELARVREATRRKTPRARSLKMHIFAFAGALSVAAATALTWHQLAKTPAFVVGGEAGSVGAFLAAPTARELPLQFADGTRIALSAGSGARVASLDEHGAHIVLERGRAVASVVHRADSRWRVDVGPYQVAVVGTQFDVSWDAGARVLEIHLAQGAVLVSGGFLRDALQVRTGQTLRAFSDGGRVELLGPTPEVAPSAALLVASPPALELPVPNAAPLDPAAPAALHAAPPATPDWKALASSGKFPEALSAAERTGFDAECRHASGEELLALADAARLAGSARRAEQAYAAARNKLSGGGRASYGLGLVAFDQRGDFTTAARWFETYLREQPSGSLRAEATGRLLESLQRSGQREQARSIAGQYLSRYPHGAQAALAQQLLR